MSSIPRSHSGKGSVASVLRFFSCTAASVDKAAVDERPPSASTPSLESSSMLLLLVFTIHTPSILLLFVFIVRGRFQFHCRPIFFFKV